MPEDQTRGQKLDQQCVYRERATRMRAPRHSGLTRVAPTKNVPTGWCRCTTNFQQENYQGMNASDYGGGTPIVDVWRRDVGMAVGHVEPRPKLVSLPVSMPDPAHARIAVRFTKSISVRPGESFHTFRTFVAVHRGDYFHALADYRRFMAKQGFQMATAPEDAFGAIWCAWGYGRKVQPQQVYDSLPTAKRLGFKWVTLDDGWQNNVGDWAA